jgi:signal recognition particle GTPase
MDATYSILSVWQERILGMGDVVSLVERAQEQMRKKEKIQKKIAKK